MIRLALLLPLLATTAVAAPLRAVEYDTHGDKCAIDANGVIRCNSLSAYPQIDIPASGIVMADQPIVITPDGTLVRADPSGKPETLEVGFAVRSAGFVDDKMSTLCVLGTKGEFGCAPYDGRTTKLSLTRAKGTFVSGTFTNRSVWLVDDHRTLWCQGTRNCARMYTASKGTMPPLLSAAVADAYPRSMYDDEPDAPLYRVADKVLRLYVSDGSDTCVLQARANALVCWGWVTEPHVVSLPKATELMIAGSYLCARKRDTITCSFPGHKRPSDLPKQSPLTAKGAVRMHAGGGQLCVEDKSATLTCTSIGYSIQPLGPVTWVDRKRPD